MMTGDEKIAQLHQVERANISAADITQYGVGSVYSQGGSAPDARTRPTGWAEMIDGFRTAAYASRLKIPIIYGLDSVHGAGPVKGATVFPHNIGLGATRDPALVEEVAARRRRGVGGRGRRLPVRAGRRGGARRALGPDLRSVRRDASSSRRRWASPRRTAFRSAADAFTMLANAKHYLGDGGTANGVNNADTSGDETALRALHLTPYQAGRRGRRRIRSWRRTAAGRGRACTPTRR